MSSAKNLTLTALFAALSCLSGLLKIPAVPAPITLQLFFAMAAGVLLGRKWGALSQLLYLAAGLLGLPVFSMGGGLGYVLQPTFGFLLGLVPACWLAGLLTERRKPLLLCCLASWAGMYAVGLPWLHLLSGVPDFLITLKMGLFLFLPADAGKIAAVCLLLPRVKKALSR